MGDPVKVSPAATTQTLPKPGVSQQQTLERFNTAVQNLQARLQANPKVLENLQGDVQGAEFLNALNRIAAQNGSPDDIRELQGFLSDLPGMKHITIGPLNGKLNTNFLNALEKSFGPISRFNSHHDSPTPTTTPPVLGNYPSSTQVGNPVQTTFPSPFKPPAQDPLFTQPPVSFADRWPILPPTLNPVQGTAPVATAAKPEPDRKAEATALIADIAMAITPKGGEGGMCFSGVKGILSKVDDVARLAQLDPAVLKPPRSKANQAIWNALPQDARNLAAKLKTNKGLAAAVEKMRKDPALAEILRKSQLLFPSDMENGAHAYQAKNTLDGPDSPYKLLTEGKHGDLKPGDLSDPTKFPKGAVIVWDKSPRPAQIKDQIKAITKGRPDNKLKPAELKQVRLLRQELARVKARGQGIESGHIAVIGGNGKEYSDREYSFKPHYAEGNYRVYVLK